MTCNTFTIVSIIIIAAVLIGIRLMNSPRTAVIGNALGAAAMLAAIALTLISHGIISVANLWIGLAIGSVIGAILACKVALTQMPQFVALLNGLGGGASMLVAALMLTDQAASLGIFYRFTAAAALAVGTLTLSGSLIAAAKLHQLIPSAPWALRPHRLIAAALSIFIIALTLIASRPTDTAQPAIVIGIIIPAFILGILATLRIGGADMPIVISMLNSFSGLAAAIAGLAMANLMLTAIGAIVGAGGLILSGIMCRAMNRSIHQIIFAASHKHAPQPAPATAPAPPSENAPAPTTLNTANNTTAPTPTTPHAQTQDTAPASSPDTDTPDPADLLRNAQTVIIVPGYGMALAQAQHQVGQLFNQLLNQNKTVNFAIHPVAGRMPGHMNVLLAEAGIPYEHLWELDQANDQFPNTDLVIVIGANDVINPAAQSAQGTPIYGMPIFTVQQARHVIICNKDTKPGYAGVDNPLYIPQPTVTLMLGDANQALAQLNDALKS